VLRDTRIVRGPQARSVGKANVVIGILLVVCAAALVVVSAYGAFDIATR